MRLTILLFFSLSITYSYCQEKQQQKGKAYELTMIADGIMVEKFDSTVVDDNKFNHNNVIYKVGNVFTYKYEHLTTDNEKKFFKIINDNSGWVFVNDTSSNDPLIVKSVLLEVDNGNSIGKHIPDYSQTVLKYTFIEGNYYTKTGAIENEANTWIHPPREKYFEILELNPFPYIKAPYEMGNTWTWKLEIGDHWADGRWKLWQGSIENEYVYEITGKEIIKTDLGNIDCYVIESKAISRIGETRLTAYFSPKYGFVKLDYTNIDGSKTKLELTKFTEN